MIAIAWVTKFERTHCPRVESSLRRSWTESSVTHHEVWHICVDLLLLNFRGKGPKDPQKRSETIFVGENQAQLGGRPRSSIRENASQRCKLYNPNTSQKAPQTLVRRCHRAVKASFREIVFQNCVLFGKVQFVLSCPGDCSQALIKLVPSH